MANRLHLAGVSGIVVFVGKPHQASQEAHPKGGGPMAANLSLAELRAEVALFAATYPTPAVRRAVELAESGAVSWQQVYDLFRRSLGTALATVDGEVGA